MAARKLTKTKPESSRPLCADAIDAVLDLARAADTQGSELGVALQTLSQRLADGHYAALALIAETVAPTCTAKSGSLHDIREAVADLCHRLIQAISTEQPFDFSQASPTLLAMLFPDDSSADPLPDRRKPKRTPSAKTQRGNQRRTKTPETHPATTDQRIDSTDSPQLLSRHSVDSAGFETCACTDYQILQEFLTECLEHQTHAEQLMLVLEANPHDQESLHGLFRSVHSLKGASGVCEVDSLGRLAHLAESVLVRVRDGELTLEANLFSIILFSIDFIGRQLRSLQTAKVSGAALRYPSPPAELLQALQSTAQTGKCDYESLQLVQASLEHGYLASRESQERPNRKQASDS